ncbi:STAS domain-containing protein [Pseudoruegeria sp. SK021]|uniref:STAS domain-containing protein n=1 Tax=Pseudoruegeria sp. SK021 TaxID=1933035 RepID=UPI000A24F178|nr:STAS domain-containing protein [Pseudoruegeria sp. SK021]OSP55048.1 anti-anti-sigma factor [Pseudoruegeria sp. SK021]
MNLTSQTEGQVLLINVDEPRIDASVAIQFKDQMRELSDAHPARIVVDLSRVDFIDSSGLGAIVAAMKQLGNGRTLELASLTPTVGKVFRLTRMDSVFKIHDTPAKALRAGAESP